MKKQRLASTLLLAALLSGCSLIPNYERPATGHPAGWTDASADAPTSIARDWWKTFSSAELNALMQDALSANNDLAAAIARVQQARGLARAAGASRYPSIDAKGSIGYERNTFGDDELDDTSDAVGSAGLGISYELDLFGANRAEREAALADLDASEFNSETVALVVMSDTAKRYFNVLNLQERLAISDQNVQSARELLRIVQARFDAGATTALDVSQQKADLATTEASRALVEQNLKIARSALAVLVGKPPQSLVLTGKDMRNLTIPLIAPGQPSTLLERRPDIRAAESSLISANANIGAARAAFYPNVTLGLDWLVSASPLGDPANTALSLASAVTAPIFSGGRLEGNLETAKGRKAELLENYRKSILVSFKEVEDALAVVKASQTREDALATALTESRKAYDLSTQQYDVGSIDFQTLLDTRRTMLSAEDAYIQTRNDRLAAAVDLYKALGGGWKDGGDAQKTVPVEPVSPPPAAAPAQSSGTAPAPETQQNPGAV